MANVYKTITSDNISSVRTRLHEAIPVTGSIVSGTYSSDSNIKSYGHGMFQSVYDYPYLSSSANHIFDISLGISANDTLYSSVTSQQQKKNNIYNQMAQLLFGYDLTGSIQTIDRDGVLSDAINSTNKHLAPIFINFSRLLTKDEIQKQSFTMEFMVSSGYAQPANSSLRIQVADSGALSNYRINSPVGEYGILYATNSSGAPIDGTALQQGATSPTKVGLVFYQAGIALLDSRMFMNTASGGILSQSVQITAGGLTFENGITGSTIGTIADRVRNRMYNVSFNNTTELNSTIYFCRIDSGEFNYSSNPTYLSASQMVVKQVPSDPPVAYFTTIGLYSADNELLAVAKLSEPFRKDPSTSQTFRVRLDY
jgi:hypothetical protein